VGYDVRYNFADPNTWYVSDSGAGIFISTDRGTSWQPTNGDIATVLDTQKTPVFSVTVDPLQPQTLWIGTNQIGRIFKSTDGGISWAEKSDGITPNDGLSFRGFTVHPKNSDIVYATAEVRGDILADAFPISDPEHLGGRIYKTTNGGQSWSKVWEGEALARYVFIDSQSPDTIYASTGIWDRLPINFPSSQPSHLDCGGVGVIKSIDGGKTWAVQGHKEGLSVLYIGSLDMKPSAPSTLLAGGGFDGCGIINPQGQEDRYGGVFLTTDGGASWEKVLGGDVISSVEYCDSDPNIAYAVSLRAFYGSKDGGKTWTTVSENTAKYEKWGPPNINTGNPIDLQEDPDDCSRIIANNYDGGNFVTTDGGRTWKMVSNGYSGSDPASLLIDPNDPKRVIAGTAMAPFESTDGGSSWKSIGYSEYRGQILIMAMAPTDSKHIVASSQTEIYLTHDGGSSWSSQGNVATDNPELRIHQFAFAPSKPAEMLVARGYLVAPEHTLEQAKNINGAGVYRSTDGGGSWTALADPAVSNISILSVAVHPSDPNSLFAGTQYAGGILVSSDAGASWKSASFEGSPNAGFITEIVFDPKNATNMYASSLSGMLKSTNGGQSWSRMVAGFDDTAMFSDVEIDPSNPNTIYVSTLEHGLFYSTDGGSQFKALPDVRPGTRRAAILQLALSGNGAVLYAASSGLGVFRLGSP